LIDPVAIGEGDIKGGERVIETIPERDFEGSGERVIEAIRERHLVGISPKLSSVCV
jgi:hypothetical protein